MEGIDKAIQMGYNPVKVLLFSNTFPFRPEDCLITDAVLSGAGELRGDARPK